MRLAVGLQPSLPGQKNVRKTGIKRQLVFGILGLDGLDPAVDDRPGDHHAEDLKVDVLPFERQNLFGPETGALCYNHHGSAWFWQQGEDLVILLDDQNDRLLLPLAVSGAYPFTYPLRGEAGKLRYFPFGRFAEEQNLFRPSE